MFKKILKFDFFFTMKSVPNGQIYNRLYMYGTDEKKFKLYKCWSLCVDILLSLSHVIVKELAIFMFADFVFDNKEDYWGSVDTSHAWIWQNNLESLFSENYC